MNPRRDKTGCAATAPKHNPQEPRFPSPFVRPSLQPAPSFSTLSSTTLLKQRNLASELFIDLNLLPVPALLSSFLFFFSFFFLFFFLSFFLPSLPSPRRSPLHIVAGDWFLSTSPTDDSRNSSPAMEEVFHSVRGERMGEGERDSRVDSLRERIFREFFIFDYLFFELIVCRFTHIGIYI